MSPPPPEDNVFKVAFLGDTQVAAAVARTSASVLHHSRELTTHCHDAARSRCVRCYKTRRGAGSDAIDLYDLMRDEGVDLVVQNGDLDYVEPVCFLMFLESTPKL